MLEIENCCHERFQVEQQLELKLRFPKKLDDKIE